MAIEPTFVGIGGMKCASTWVADCLRHHPEVLLSNPKETAYFNTSSGLEGYRRFFEGSPRKAIGEFTPSYLPNAAAVSERILATLGRVQIVAIVRNPSQRYVSHYKWVLGRRDDLDKRTFSKLSLRTFRQANAAEPRLLAFGHYRDSLQIYVDTFGRENVHVMLYEDVRSDPHAVLRDLYAFLGVDPNFVPASLGETVRQGYVPRYAFLERAKVKAYFLLKHNAPWAIGPLKALKLERLLRRINAERRSSLVVEPEVTRALAEHYAEETERMREFLGRPLDAWR